MATYLQIEDKQMQAQLDQRYRAEIEALENLEFHHLAYCLEDHGPISALKQPLAGLLALFNGEVVRIKWPLQLTLANVLLAVEDPPAIALCMGMGIKFYTPFYDGTVMISSDFQSRMTMRPGSNIIRLPSQGSLADTWTEHQTQALVLAGQVGFLSEEMVFGDYTLMSNFEEFEANFL